MSTYVPNLTDVFPEPSLYRPDFNFFSQMLQRKQMQYDEGVSRAMSAREMIRNAPLSDFANVKVRDEYLKSADGALKNIASADFSLPQNVSAAMNIYKPFWEDKMLLQDMSDTKWYQGEMAKLMSWKDSPDDKVRSKFNGIAMAYLNNGLDALRNANRNPEAYAKVEKRQAVPFTNIEEYLTEQATKGKMTIKYDDPNGPYLVENENGQRSKKQYAAWAQSMMGNNFYQQFLVSGVAENEERIKLQKRLNPNLNDQEIKAKIAKDVVNELSQGFERRHREVDADLAKVDAQITAISNNKDAASIQVYQQLMNQRAELVGKKAGIDTEYLNFNTYSKADILQQMLNSPNQYLSTLAKQRVIDNWSTGRASIQSVSIKENSAWKNAEDVRIRNQQLIIDQQKNAIDQQKVDLQRQNPTNGKKPAVSKNSAGQPIDEDGNVVVLDGVSKEKGIAYLGPSGTDITRNAATAADVFNRKQESDYREAHNLIFDQKGILSFAKKLGMTEMELSQIATALQNEVADLDYNFTNDEKNATNKLADKLLNTDAVKKAGIKKIEGPSNFRSALIAYIGDYYENTGELAVQGAVPSLSGEEFEALTRYATAVKKLDMYNANEAKRQELLDDLIAKNKDPEISRFVTTDGSGKRKLLGISDLAKTDDFKKLASNLKLLVTTPNIAGSMLPSFMRPDVEVSATDLTSEKLAKAFFEGRLGMRYDKSPKTISPYGIVSNNTQETASLYLDGKTYNLQGEGISAVNRILGQYGRSDKAAQTYSNITNSVVPNYLMFQSMTGQQGSVFKLITTPNKTIADGDNAALVLSQVVNPANADIYDAQKQPEKDVKVMQAIRALLSDEKNMDEWVSAYWIPQGVNGQKTVRVVFKKPLSDESKLTIAGVDMSVLANKSEFNFVVNDNASATAINALPSSTGMQVYDVLTRGEKVSIDPLLKKFGFNFEVVPSRTGNQVSDYVTVNLNYSTRVNEIDPNTKQLVSKMVPNTTSKKINIRGEDAKSPDEIVNELYSIFYDVMLLNRQKQVEYDGYMKSNTGSGATFSISDDLKQRNLGHLIGK